MKKEVLDRYLNKWVVLGVPHTFREGALFYYQGNITDIDDETLTIRDNTEELVLELELIKSIKASGCGANGIK